VQLTTENQVKEISGAKVRALIDDHVARMRCVFANAESPP
jgi:hypothetical protein